MPAAQVAQGVVGAGEKVPTAQELQAPADVPPQPLRAWPGTQDVVHGLHRSHSWFGAPCEGVHWSMMAPLEVDWP